MNVSTKSEYGLRALIYLAGHSAREAVPAREIAEKWRVPIKYLEQILKTLRDGGFITAQVGVGGGYRLSRPATLITAGEVIRLLDGRIAPMGCVSSSHYEPCEFEPDCGLKTLWARARAALVGVLDQTTIADLCTSADRPQVISLKSSSKR
ncbi:MAG: Rrf2 family transcriptional regulator [Acidobacteria bacterium]|nr:Rrf2 family transcriptional regulator [Acidobacteriota bacterium]MCW5969871.1 Rrf2 family transcriptional regulator [Blastocatellales bacterium]